MMQGELDVSVYYEDTDFSGFVYHANYLKYFDRAREVALGFKNLQDMYAEGRHFVVKDAKLTYHKPARFGDLLQIKTRFDDSHSVLLACHHEAIRKSTGESLVSGLITLVLVNERGFPLRLSQSLK